MNRCADNGKGAHKTPKIHSPRNKYSQCIFREVTGRGEEARAYLQEALDGLHAKDFQKSHVWIVKFTNHLEEMDPNQLKGGVVPM
eukprot:738309-Prorocentrum_minimum.AAC.8